MRLDRVVVGVDFSEPSLAAGRWVARHFAANAELFLVHAVELPATPSFAPDLFHPWDREWADSEAELARERLIELGELWDGARATPEVRFGRAAREIAAVAEERSADLVVVGEQGRRGLIWGRLGSTAERVVRCSPVPILLARGMPPAAPRRVLVPVDGGDLTPRLLAWARFLQEESGAALVALHVLSFDLYGRLSLISTEAKAREVERQAHEEAQRWLEEQARAASLDPEKILLQVRSGHPSLEILAAARRHDSDLVVIGGRGAGAVARALLGSVVNAVLRGAACPVLVLVDERGG